MYTMNSKTKEKPMKVDIPVRGTVVAGYKMYNVPELASLLQISPVSVRNYIKRGMLKGQRIGKGYLVSELALKQFLKVE